ncbi:hypothetical protein F3N42_13730 [Marinihelvus fidelis]|uniref:Sulfurtransferase complex subunit TusB n=1 Tax=Marinihelvus fidelis TaxID=2613842 RepID=A0A5N0T443_9GAMM|nr:DsrH/TusB family sulfur metabolism protein [Marinihelvus fidelis]KAA9129840.1 hypothetical protein F3N42_13730 [Marinihelvus fidelis]
MSDDITSRLHLLMSARADAVADCLGQLGPDDEVLLVDSGVSLLAPVRPGDDGAPALAGLLARARRVCALETDVRARGLPASPDIPLVGDDDWVRMVHRHRHVLSWT